MTSTQNAATEYTHNGGVYHLLGADGKTRCGRVVTGTWQTASADTLTGSAGSRFNKCYRCR